jgi:hypothetical protein
MNTTKCMFTIWCKWQDAPVVDQACVIEIFFMLGCSQTLSSGKQQPSYWSLFKKSVSSCMSKYWILHTLSIKCKVMKAKLGLNQMTFTPCISFVSYCSTHGSVDVRLLGLRVRITPRALISISCECCVLGRGLCIGLMTDRSFWVWCVWVYV